MKIVVIGGSGLIGSKLVEKLGEHGHEAVAASPASGVNTITGEGLAEVLRGAQVVVDVSNSPSFEEEAAMEFFEIVKSIADASTDGDKVRLPHALIRPMAADDVASAVGGVATGLPLNGTVEVAGPEQFHLDELIRRGLGARNDPRAVVADPGARYFGAELTELTLVPGDDAQLGETRFDDWLGRSASRIPPTRPQPTAVAAASSQYAQKL